MKFLPAPIVGVISGLLYALNTLFWSVPIFICAIFKVLLPFRPVRRTTARILAFIASAWITGNNIIQRMMTSTRLEVHGLQSENLDKKGWYLVLSNHQSWVDILVLQRIFNRRIPLLKFFIKKEMFWMPILGQVWWIFDFPFMKRYSSSFLEKNPHLRGRDLEITRKACEKFKDIPVSVMNFVEGTRFTIEKHLRQASPFSHLLIPRAGGVALTLATMGGHLNQIIDVTIVYPHGIKSFWAFLCGKVKEIQVKIETLPVTKDICGDYMQDLEFRAKFQAWLNELWVNKDRTIDAFFLPAPPQPTGYLPEPTK